MNSPSDEDFRAAYAPFEQHHAEQREAMLAGLTRVTPSRRAVRLRPAVLAALEAEVVIGFGIVGLETARPTSAYGMDGIRERLQSLRSLHVKGVLFERTKTPFGVATIRFPVERYYERPSRYFSVAYGFSSNGNDNLTHVTKSYSANDGKRNLIVLDDQKK